ncbi:Chromosome partition protein Smc [compost metagenome]
MTTSFYRAFEDRLRGSRELIKQRQQVYLPFLQPLKQIYAENQALDLGCGRGEWLEVLLEDGFQAHGVDLDEGMLDACQALNLPAELADALTTLESTPDASLSVVSGFHIAEHMPFSSLQTLVAHALRTLKPAGLLILETPNPENLVVGTNNFYLDPTHERPIPHLVLNFLAEHSGFQRTKTLRLQEPPKLATETNLELMHVLGGASPDYAIVSQKAAIDEQLALFDEAFAKEYGLALDMLAWRYDSGLKSSIREVAEKVDSNTQKEAALSGQMEQLQNRVELLEQISAEDMHARQLLEQALTRVEEQKALLDLELSEVKCHAEMLKDECEEVKREFAGASERIDHLKTQLKALNLQLEGLTVELSEVTHHKHQIHSDLLNTETYKRGLHASLVSLEERMHSIQHQLNEALGNTHHWWQQAAAQEQHVKALLTSTSWRITWPLRALSHAVSRIASLPVRLIKATARPFLHLAMHTVLERPALRTRLARILQRHPKLHHHLRLFAKRRNLIGYFPPVDTNLAMHEGYSTPEQEGLDQTGGVPRGPDLSALSAEARRYFHELNDAIKQQKPGSL